MQSQARHIRSHTRQATQPVQPRPHIPAVIEETLPRRWQIRYYHNDQIGTPCELTGETGEILWSATYRAWGNTLTEEWLPEQAPAQKARTTPPQQARQENLSQNLRFQGQYFDEETGLQPIQVL